MDGTRIRVHEVIVGDHTGCITLTARNAQIDLVQPGNTIEVRNAKIDMFQGFMRLSVDKWGAIRLADEPANFQINTHNDLSQIEYELVNVPPEDNS